MSSPIEFAHLQIRLEEIIKATNSFADENLIGQGGFGKIYKGTLLLKGQSIDIVARRLHHDYGQGDIEFWTEIMLLASLKHENVVSIVGFCDENDEKIIINKYEARRSLDKYLSSATLTWMQRLQICVDVARAVKYIHHDDGHDFSVIHRNIKSSKILLDDNWKPKLSGFEISLKNTRARRDRLHLADVIGTLGYVDPTYENTGTVTHKSDVYSLGAVLFEVLCGKRAFNADRRVREDRRDLITVLDRIKFTISKGLKLPEVSMDNIAGTALEKFRSIPGMLKQLRKLWDDNDTESPTSENEQCYPQIAIQIYNERKLYETPERHPTQLEMRTFSNRQCPPSSSRHPSLCTNVHRSPYGQPSSSIGQPSSFTKVKPLSFGKLSSLKYVTLPSSTTNVKRPPSIGQPSTFTNVKAPSYGEVSSVANVKPPSIEQQSSFTNLKPESCEESSSCKNVSPPSSITINMNSKSSSNGESSANTNVKPPSVGQPSSFTNVQSSSFDHESLSSSSKNHPPSATHDYTPLEQTENVMQLETSSSKERRFALHPLFTMKRLDLYKHSPNEELLTQLAILHYEQGKLGDMIDPDLWKQMNPQSFKIFSGTAHSCLKEPRSLRPDIDQIVINLEKALELQRKYDHSQVATQAEGSSFELLKGKNLGHLEIPLVDIKLATNNFHKTCLIGSGTYGKVYKGELELPMQGENKCDHSNKRKITVAIKDILIREDKQGKKGFFAEIDLLTNCKHPNIVSLLGFCHEDSHMILIYEFASNGSLGDYLGGNDHNLPYLNWEKRIKICIDIARGLNYLHTRVEDERRIIHRDIKSDNILLGSNLEAKISDFGLSRFHPEKEKNTIQTDTIAGTEVYLDPEYRHTGKLKKESDIYSFGVVMFEIMSGKIANDPIYMAEDNKGLAPVARRRFKEGSINEMVDPKIMAEKDELKSTLSKGPNQDSITTFSKIAHQCLAETQVKRPTANLIIEKLEEALSFQVNHKDNLQIALEDIKKATQDFSHGKIIGEGGFGKVYEGQLTHANGCISNIVAKRLDKSQGQGDHEFLTELEILFEYKHENIIGLVGYCNEKVERIIVYEPALKGSLDDHLGDDSLTWIKRLHICIDVATGLAFLHGGAPTQEMVIHRDLKCANILLTDDWKAKISDFGLSLIIPKNKETKYVISDLVGTVGYVDPLYESTGFLTKESDIYSFGVVLFEIFHGKLLVPNDQEYDPQSVATILYHIHDQEELYLQALPSLKKHIAPESMSTFQMIISQCLDEDRTKRPTSEEVLQQLIIALESQEDYEIWEPKLPKDYREIIQMSKSPEIYLAQKKKDIYNLFAKGILIQEDKGWFSLGSNGERNKMISAKEFTFIHDGSSHEWLSIPESKFKNVAEILDITNLMIKIETRTDLLSPNVIYGVFLVFKFCDSRRVSSKPTYVNLKYRKGSEALHAYFATWRDDDWMMIELFQFLNHKEDTNFMFLLESFSTYYCGDDAIYVEGIEFRAIHNVKHEEIEQKNDIQQFTGSYMNVDQVHQLLTNYDEGEKLFLLTKVNGKNHLMLPAKAALHDFTNVKLFISKSSAESRFQEVIELLPQQVLRINCTVRSCLLSPDTEYVCYLVFKLSEKSEGLHCPVKVRDVRERKKEEAIIYFLSPNPWNRHDLIEVPKQRGDGWMEVNVWNFNSKHNHKNDCLPVNLKLTSYEGTMSGLIVCGLEFRPM